MVCLWTDGRCTVTWLPNFLGWVDLLTHGAPQARFARQSSAIIYIYIYFSFLLFFFFFETLPKTSQISCTLHGGTILKNRQPRYVLLLMPPLFLSEAVYSFSCYVRDFLKWNHGQELLMKLTNRLWIGKKEKL